MEKLRKEFFFRKGTKRSMSNKLNTSFLNIYLELDKICCLKFGVVTGGVTEYINRLINARFAPERDEVLPRLVRYRNIRNRMAHEAGALTDIDEINKSDLRWLESFKKDMNKKKDPISVYLRKARKYARRRRARKYFFIFLTVLLLLAAAAAAAYFLLF